jgi:mannose-1-phosphate guanylyltransferase
MGRNTGPAVLAAAITLLASDPDAIMLVLPSDHVIKGDLNAIISGMRKAADDGLIVTFGVVPHYPETGYGYIEADLSYPSNSNREIFRVDSFKEKPNLATAEKYLKKNSFYWNSGIFVWNVSTVVNSLRVYQPTISKVFERMLPYYYTDKEQQLINEQFPLCENISIDYAIMEKADEIFVFPANFGWSDLGTWGSLHMNSQRDAQNNALIGQNIKVYESRNCVVHTTQEKKVVVQGLDGYIVAEKDNTLLICRLSEEQRISEFME